MRYPDCLEFKKVKKYLSSLCQSEVGRAKVRELEPLREKEKIEERLDLVEETQRLLKEKVYYNFSEVSDLGSLLYETDGQVYDFDELKKITANIRVSERIIQDKQRYELFDKFKELAGKLASCNDLLERFDKIFNEDGEFKDNATPHLFSVRKRQKQVRRNIVTELQKKLGEYSEHNYLHDDVVTQRDGRFVVPVKKSSATYVNGIMHGESSSHNSVYLEPAEVVKLNNEVSSLEDQERQELYRILREITNEVGAQRDQIQQNTGILAILDYNTAAARWSNRIKSAKPRLCKENRLSLINARHPLLIESFGKVERVIPFDLELGNEYNLLVISGPNTGGKTITLKTVGLLTIMAMCGLPIPAKEESEIGMFEAIYADIGDNQSLEDSLSTFSSHISALKRMLDSQDKKVLVLIDEIGSATDPEQGSALGQAVLEKLSDRNALGVVTTHYTSLKVFAETNEHCVNAAMQFDPDNHVPTYQFKIGLPGNSFAIDVASRLGMRGELIDRARHLAGSQNVELTDLIRKMSEEKKRLSREIYQYELKTTLLRQKADEHQRQIDKMNRELKEIKKRSRLEAREYLTSLQKELNAEIDSIKKNSKAERKKNYEQELKKVTKLSSELDIEMEDLRHPGRHKLKDAQIGKRVWLDDLGTEGVIIEISRSGVKIDIDGMYYTTSEKNLFEAAEKPKEIKESAISAPAPQAKFELMLLGYRYEEAMPEVEKLIDNAVISGLNYVRIVHGKGTGALRSKIRRYLKQNKLVEDFFSPAPEAGGDGVTVCKLIVE